MLAAVAADTRRWWTGSSRKQRVVVVDSDSRSLSKCFMQLNHGSGAVFLAEWQLIASSRFRSVSHTVKLCEGNTEQLFSGFLP